MSRGGHHEIECQQILSRVHWFIDNELDSADTAEIQSHLDECAPCLDEVAIDRLVKAMIARCCNETAPVELRQRVVFSIHQVQIELGHRRLDLD